MKFLIFTDSRSIKPDGPIKEYKDIGFTFEPTQLEDGSFKIKDRGPITVEIETLEQLIQIERTFYGIQIWDDNIYIR